MRRFNWTECEGGWSSGPYLIEKLGGDLWVLSFGRGAAARLLTSADSATELEALTSAHREVVGVVRPVILGTAYLAAVAGVVAGSMMGSTIALVLSALLIVAVMAKVSEYMASRRMVRVRMSPSVR